MARATKTVKKAPKAAAKTKRKTTKAAASVKRAGTARRTAKRK